MLFCLLMFTSVMLFAQAPVIDLAEIFSDTELIFLTGLGGLGVMSLIQLIKEICTPSKKWVAFLISLIVSMLASFVFLLLIPGDFIVWKFIVYSLLVTAQANGIYRAKNKEKYKKDRE